MTTQNRDAAEVREVHREWPMLPPLAEWQNTCDTLHMWLQIIGKVRLELSPRINHSWGSTLYVTTRGLTTSPIPWASGSFAVDLDFISHALSITRSDGRTLSFALEPMSVARFYSELMQALSALGISVSIHAHPVEVMEAIPFAEDTVHAGYDAAAVHRFWQALVVVDRVFTDFRARFIGKASPVHLFWGSFDLAGTRFSGRTAPKHPGGAPNCPDRVMVEAYSHELWSAGFWPGTGLGEAAFYAYAYPTPAGFEVHPVQPEAAYFHRGMREFILPYEAVRMAADPKQAVLSFLQTTYEGAATLANWDRSALEQPEAR